MFKLKKWLSATLIALLSAWTLSASADPFHHYGGRHFGGHFRPGFGFYFGAPLYPRPFYPSYPYYPAYPYYPREIITVPVQPPVYIERERSQPQNAPLAEGYWYYCNDPAGYYPYVKDCANGWQQVEPTPQN
ncbi:hypothetical protein U737_18090 [Methylomonas sp. LW13]|uniref:hypothetical protein n=1 Tax=unclassified Methylomonas TaxID=2608980 RepID=UPI00051B40A3|nr:MULTISPECIES: hypothetical protein [unclassified Methylomonas]PKD38561.1 hypothetical protein CWO84_20195 [Methylomonas sp. Kb3]QBC28660.1 hypothetical protein U737_18090 [Methylomonas sp. LW13]